MQEYIPAFLFGFVAGMCLVWIGESITNKEKPIDYGVKLEVGKKYLITHRYYSSIQPFEGEIIAVSTDEKYFKTEKWLERRDYFVVQEIK